MKYLIILTVFLSVGWLFYEWCRQQSTPEKIQQSEPGKYVQGLQNAVQKAERARDQANEAIRRETQTSPAGENR